METKPLIGFIGQGYVGKNYGNDFEARGFPVVRYSLEEPFVHNKDKIAGCDIVFVAVWTPTVPDTTAGPLGVRFDSSIIESVLPLVGRGKTVVLKSTILPGTTRRLQEQFPGVTLMYSPEFLSVATAAEDAAHPFSNILGLPVDDEAHRTAAGVVMAALPKAPFELVCTSDEAEFIKYSHNGSAYAQIIFFNAMYDLAQKVGADWSVVHKAMLADPFVCNRYAQPVHKSGRGAGGGCFIKDFSALRSLYEKMVPEDAKAIAVLRAQEEKNIELLTETGKDRALLEGVYGPFSA